MDQDAIEVRRRRALFRSARRGTREADMVIGGFARRHVGALDPAQLDRLEALLAESDPDLLGWIIGTRPVPRHHDNDVLALLRDFKNSL